MAFETKKSELDDAIFNPKKHPLPEGLKRRLDIVSWSFFTARMRNLDMLGEKDKRLYGFMTHYDGNGYCWIQPMTTKTLDHDPEYNRYVTQVNKAARENKLDFLSDSSVKIGMDIVAQYEVDLRWYRAMVVDQLSEDEWLVLFVDFGNLQRCQVDQIRRPMHDKHHDHFHSPLQAVCCRLYNIIPNSPQDQEKMDILMTDFYTKNTNSILDLYVRNIRPDYVVDCDLFLPKRGSVGEDRLHRRHIGQFLVDQGLATFADLNNARATKLPPKHTEAADLITIEDDQEKKDVKPNIKFLSPPLVVNTSI